MNDYLPKMKKIYTFDSEAWGSVDWVLVLAGSALSILCVGGVVYWIVSFILHLLKISRGKASIKDGAFWKRMALSLLILFLLMVGAVFLIFEQIYDGMVSQGWG